MVKNAQTLRCHKTKSEFGRNHLQNYDTPTTKRNRNRIINKRLGYCFIIKLTVYWNSTLACYIKDD